MPATCQEGGAARRGADGAADQLACPVLAGKGCRCVLAEAAEAGMMGARCGIMPLVRAWRERWLCDG